jgi:hypothetical protein
MTTKFLSLVFGYIMEVAMGLGDIIRMVKNDFINEYKFKNLI